MRISLLNAGKRYNREWIFRHFNFQFEQGHQYAITGPNGSGKSTLLQVVAGAAMVSEGEVRYEADTGSLILDRGFNFQSAHPENSKTDASNIELNPESSIQHPVSSIQHPYKYLSFAAPYLELIEEMTALEFLTFHSRFKPFTTEYKEMLNEVGLLSAADKQIRYFSSGMKQRLKLAQAFFSDTPVLLLDEPATNLDAEGIKLYLTLIEKYASGKLVIVSSNDEQEYDFCKEVIRIGDYK